MQLITSLSITTLQITFYWFKKRRKIIPGGLLSGAEGRGLEPMNRLRDPIFSMKDSLRGMDGVMGDCCCTEINISTTFYTGK